MRLGHPALALCLLIVISLACGPAGASLTEPTPAAPSVSTPSAVAPTATVEGATAEALDLEDLPPASLEDLLETKVADEGWTQEEALLAGLRVLAGQTGVVDAFGAIPFDGEGSGVVYQALNYLQSGADPAVKTEIGDLLAIILLRPSGSCSMPSLKRNPPVHQVSWPPDPVKPIAPRSTRRGSPKERRCCASSTRSRTWGATKAAFSIRTGGRNPVRSGPTWRPPTRPWPPVGTSTRLSARCGPSIWYSPCWAPRIIPPRWRWPRAWAAANPARSPSSRRPYRSTWRRIPATVPASITVSSCRSWPTRCFTVSRRSSFPSMPGIRPIGM